MKKLILSALLTIVVFNLFAQTINLKTNGYSLNFKKIDTLFYAEYSTSSTVKANAKENDATNVNLKYSFGKISKSKAELLQANPIFISNYYAYSDGTLQAPTSQLFFKPFDITTFKKAYNDIGIIEEHPSLNGYYYLYVTDKKYNNGEIIFNLCNKIFNEKLVQVIEPVFELQLQQQNPLRPWQWSIRNNGNVPGGIIGADMQVENAWCNSTGTNIRVAVIDDGVDLAHPDLQANLVAGFDATGNNSGGAPAFDNGHGTNCAGIIASVNNTIGTIGVAFNSRIIPIRMGIVNTITGAFNTNNTWIANCFAEAVNRGADVISNSWGGGSPSSQIDAAINNALTNGRNGRGCVVLFSTGNRNSSISYPSTLSNVIAIGASTPCDTRKRSSSDPTQVNPGVNTDPEGTSCDGENWWGSNFGTGLDVLAPGVWISTTDNVGAGGFVGGDYNDHFNGTSSACPNAAAVIALILAANPNLTNVQARNILEQTCDKVGGYNYQANVGGQPNGTWSNQAGYGRINADRAVRIALGLGQPTIDGANAICSNSSSSYTLNSAICTITNIWSITNANGSPTTATISPTTGNTTTVAIPSTLTFGTLTLTATLSNGTIITRNIHIGSPSISNAAFVYNGQSFPLAYNFGGSGVNTICKGLQGAVSTTWSSANSVSWTGPGYSFPAVWYNTGLTNSVSNMNFHIYNAPVTGFWTVTGSNACGSTTYPIAIQSIVCSNPCEYYKVSPNPTVKGGEIIIIAKPAPLPCDNPLPYKSGITAVNIYDEKGILVTTVNGNQTTKMNTRLSANRRGLMIVEIVSGTHMERHKIIVQ